MIRSPRQLPECFHYLDIVLWVLTSFLVFKLFHIVAFGTCIVGLTIRNIKARLSVKQGSLSLNWVFVLVSGCKKMKEISP